MLKSQFGEGLDAGIQRLLPFLFRGSLDANLLSVVGALISIAGAVVFAQGSFRLGALLVLGGCFFDLVDGAVARHAGTSSPFGAFLDSSLDRVVDMAVLLGILMHYASVGSMRLAWLAGVALVATVMVSYAKARAEALVGEFKGGLLERAERIVILMAGALLGWMPLALGIVAVGSTITAAQRFAIAHRLMSRAADEPSAATDAQAGAPDATVGAPEGARIARS